MKPASVLNYVIDGTTLSLPLAQQPRRNYKRPRWLPVVFDPCDASLDQINIGRPKGGTKEKGRAFNPWRRDNPKRGAWRKPHVVEV